MSHIRQGGETMKQIIIRGVPEDLHKRAKLQAVKEDSSLKGIIIKALTEYLDREEKKAR
jgi:predicted HicB family RNase H-like nuclease